MCRFSLYDFSDLIPGLYRFVPVPSPVSLFLFGRERLHFHQVSMQGSARSSFCQRDRLIATIDHDFCSSLPAKRKGSAKCVFTTDQVLCGNLKISPMRKTSQPSALRISQSSGMASPMSEVYGVLEFDAFTCRRGIS